ncbi:hypothetical protein [Spirosoma utsteinense]|uniref:DUF11 domain-containing protein n=1 Tax=Spirosoma utsteinense TaxID=2585773 RepID=A0ABR6WER6_9BACT|nr:hypothetical protein [Spirosoma utsteinense]MBC3789125.1 hypothetical protein [Spirosoma utsteinense]MBC3794501.1 hypothetical protein [Spirosoma utsteinense]
MKELFTQKVWVRIVVLCLLCCTSGWAQVELSLRYQASDSKYHMYARPTVDPTPSVTNRYLTDGSSLITITTIAGSLSIGTVTSVNPAGIWDLAQTQRNNGVAASGAPANTDFFSFYPTANFSSILYSAGTEVELFNFDVVGTCPGSGFSILPSGTQLAEDENGGQYVVGSYYSVRGYAGGLGTNHFSAPYSMSAACQAPPSPDLVVSVGQPSPALVAGLSSTMPVVVSNIGNSPTTGVTSFTLSLPANLTVASQFTTGSFSCSTVGSQVSCTTSSTITAGSSLTAGLPITPTVAAIGSTPVFSATVATPGESITANNSSGTVTAATPVQSSVDVLISMGYPAPAPTAGQSSNIPVLVTNSGGSPASPTVVAVITIPVGTSFGTFPVNNNGWTCALSGRVASCTLAASISPGGSSAFVVPFIPATSQAGTSLTISPATVSTPGEMASNTTNNSSSAIVINSVQASSGMVVQARALLSGPAIVDNNGLMRDNLRTAGVLPAVEPYTAMGYTYVGGPVATSIAAPYSTVFGDRGVNSIVDWVILELRNPANPTAVVAS